MTSDEWWPAPPEPVAEVQAAQAEAEAYAADLAAAPVPVPAPEPVAAEPVPAVVAEPPFVPEPPVDEAPPPMPGGPRGRQGLLVGATALAVLVLLGAFAWFVGPVADARTEQRTADRRLDALAEARQLALNLVSIDYRTLDRDLKRISDSTTGKARTEFDDKILKNETYKSLVKEKKAVLKGTIKRIGLEPCGADDSACKRGTKAVVLVFLDQESTNSTLTTPRIDRNRVALTLVRGGGHWLVGEVSVV